MSWFTGWKMRRLPIFLGCIVLLAMAAGEVRGDSVCATLSVGPADIVTLSDSDPGFGSLYTGAVYAGELDWTPVATPADPNPGSPFSTYCIDIFSDIYLGQSYTYNVLPLGSALSPNTPWASTQYKTLLATAVCDIELLWGKYYDCIYQGSSPQDIADRAAAFQIDIWKIIYGKDLVVSPAWGSTGWECYQSKWLSNLGNTPDQVGGARQLRGPGPDYDRVSSLPFGIGWWNRGVRAHGHRFRGSQAGSRSWVRVPGSQSRDLSGGAAAVGGIFFLIRLSLSKLPPYIC
jgi:hypothetical protein